MGLLEGQPDVDELLYHDWEVKADVSDLVVLSDTANDHSDAVVARESPSEPQWNLLTSNKGKLREISIG